MLLLARRRRPVLRAALSAISAENLYDRTRARHFICGVMLILAAFVASSSAAAYLPSGSLRIVAPRSAVRLCDADELPDKFDFDAGLLKCALLPPRKTACSRQSN